MSRPKVKQLVRQYRHLLSQNGFLISSVFLFGSYVNGNPTRWSDIDVAIVAKKMPNGWWRSRQVSSRLSLQVDKRLEPHIFSVKDFANEADPLVYEIKKTGIKI